jgi:hypothetical protein
MRIRKIPWVERSIIVVSLSSVVVSDRGYSYPSGVYISMLGSGGVKLGFEP